MTMNEKDPSVKEFSDSLTQQQVLILQGIIGALILGVVMFLGVTLFVLQGEESVLIAEDSLILTAILAAMTLGSIVFFFALPAFASKIQMNSGGVASPSYAAFSRLQLLTIMRFAVLEGAAMLGVVFVFIEQGLIHLFAVVPILVLGLLYFPTRERIIQQFSRHIKKDDGFKHAAVS